MYPVIIISIVIFYLLGVYAMDNILGPFGKLKPRDPFSYVMISLWPITLFLLMGMLFIMLLIILIKTAFKQFLKPQT